jgi:hypothetical protein
MWLMARAGYLGRDVAGLGAEPPAETVTEDEEPAVAQGDEAAGTKPAPAAPRD